MKYPDKVKLVTVTSDGYGDRTVTSTYEVPALFVKRSGIARGMNTEGEISDASVYLKHNDEFVLEKKDELEGMYLQSEPFSEHNWYRVTRAHIAERKLLNNAIDNIYCRLEKVAGLANDIS